MKIKILTWLTLFIIFLSGCAIKDKLGITNSEEGPASSVFADETYAQKLSDKVPLHLYFVGDDGKSLKMEVRYIPLTEAKKSVQNLSGSIMRELIQGPSQDAGLKKSLPEGTKLLNSPTFKDGCVTVNLSKEFVEKMQLKDPNAEKMSIFSIVNSLTEVKEIERVKFLVEGSVKKDYKGTLKIDSAFPRNPSMIDVKVNTNIDEAAEVAETAEAAETMEVLD